MDVRRLDTIHEARFQQQTWMGGAEGTTSLREYGGIWGVHGALLLDAAVLHRASFASMIDIDTHPEFEVNVAAAKAKVPGLEVEFVKGDFREPSLHADLTPVDTAMLFNVLLHQENYLDVIGRVCAKTRRNVCVTQPCLKEHNFLLPGSASLLQFWPEELKDHYRKGAHWPKEGRTDRFTHVHWMWGHTASHLIDVFRGFGWKLAEGVRLDGFLGEHWDCPMMRFTPA